LLYQKVEKVKTWSEVGVAEGGASLGKERVRKDRRTWTCLDVDWNSPFVGASWIERVESEKKKPLRKREEVAKETQ